MPKNDFEEKIKPVVPEEKPREIEKEPSEEIKEKKKEIKEEKEIKEKVTKAILPTPPREAVKMPVKDPVLTKIEDILEEDLIDIYSFLDEPLKREFRTKGEETSVKIKFLIAKTKIMVKQIFELIKEWLAIIPGINKFFVDKEAKIKTDKILKLTKK